MTASTLIARPAVPADVIVIETLVDRCVRALTRAPFVARRTLVTRPARSPLPPPPTRAPLVSRSNQSHYGKFDVAALVENASVAVVAVDPGADGDVVGFLAVVPEFPTPHGVPKARVMELLSWTSSTSRALGYAHGASADRRVRDARGARPPRRRADAPRVFPRAPAPRDAPARVLPGGGARSARRAPRQGFKMERHALYETSRAHVAPRLRVRAAKVEDNDDLIPLVSAVAADPAAPGGALSRVPVSGDDDPSGRPGSSSRAEEVGREGTWRRSPPSRGSWTTPSRTRAQARPGGGARGYR